MVVPLNSILSTLLLVVVATAIIGSISFHPVSAKQIAAEGGRLLHVESDDTNLNHAINALKRYQKNQVEQMRNLYSKEQSSSSQQQQSQMKAVGLDEQGNNLGKSSKKEGEISSPSSTTRQLKEPKRNKCTRLVAASEGWTSWTNDVSTNKSIFFPKNDFQLHRLIQRSKRRGCIVRMLGSSQSQDGIVMQRKEKRRIVLISLAFHSTNVDGWSDSINNETSTFRIGAGKSWYDVSALIRPHGYVLKSRTAGASFNVGGTIANMVHGSGRNAGFIHDDVTKMLVLASSGTYEEVEGDDLKYWRSSIGLLGMIVAVEMSVHSEAIPFATVNPLTGELVVDESKGGMVMSRERTVFPFSSVIPSEAEVIELIMNVTAKAYQTMAMYDTAHFFFSAYTNTLAEYRTDFSGPRFSGYDGPYADTALAAQYEVATQANQDIFAGVSISGTPKVSFNEETICETFCIPGSGPPPLGDGSPCIKIPSSLVPGMNLCEVPIEVAAATSEASFDLLDGILDTCKETSNDGYYFSYISDFYTSTTFFPARALPHVLGAWYQVFGSPLIDYHINGLPNFRLIDPEETAVLNPVPTMNEVEEDFNQQLSFIPGAFDIFLPPPPPGVPDGLIEMETTNFRDVFDDNSDKYYAAIQTAFASIPTNPFFPYGEYVVKDCDILAGIFPCDPTAPPAPGVTCCNPPVPIFPIHFGKGWGYGFDTSTTPTTGKLQPFQDEDIIASIFSTGSKKSSISDFNAKRAELDAEMFAGGGVLRWLDPSSRPKTDFDVRKLRGQTCGSDDFALDFDAECIRSSCVDSICVK